MAITQGLLTYEAEGTEGGRYHSRILHVPSERSGLTIGRGYDMKERSQNEIEEDLANAGLARSDSELLAKAAGTFGPEAEEFIESNNLQEFEITIEVQEELFNICYEEILKDVKRICDKADCVEIYGEVSWDILDPKIQEVIVDLRFRGDYTPTSRKHIQKYVASNDLAIFSILMKDRSLWVNVPRDRFRRRCEVF